MKNIMYYIYTLLKIIIMIIAGCFGLFALGGVIGLVLAIKEGRAFETVMCLIVICISGGIYVLLNLLAAKFEDKARDADHQNTTSYSSSRSSSSSGGLWSSSYDYKPSQSHDSGYDDVIAAAAAQEMSRVTATYGEDWGGYDAEAPQPWDKPYDPEAPQPWDTDWRDAE